MNAVAAVDPSVVVCRIEPEAIDFLVQFGN